MDLTIGPVQIWANAEDTAAVAVGEDPGAGWTVVLDESAIPDAVDGVEDLNAGTYAPLRNTNSRNGLSDGVWLTQATLGFRFRTRYITEGLYDILNQGQARTVEAPAQPEYKAVIVRMPDPFDNTKTKQLYAARCSITAPRRTAIVASGAQPQNTTVEVQVHRNPWAVTRTP